jgi:hypothetical protein
MPHFAFTLLLALLLSVGLALIGEQSLRERVYSAIYRFACCLALTVAGSWAMYLIHG